MISSLDANLHVIREEPNFSVILTRFDERTVLNALNAHVNRRLYYFNQFMFLFILKFVGSSILWIPIILALTDISEFKGVQISRTTVKRSVVRFAL